MNDFKVNENKRISNFVKLMRPEIKKDNTLKSEINQRSFANLRTWKFIFNTNGHQIVDFGMRCAVNLFFSFKTHKNIQKLIVLFSPQCMDFWLWFEFFDWNIFVGAPVNLFEFVCWSQLFSQQGTSQPKHY